MGECPDGYSIERINNNGNYELTNCKWILLKDQPKNTRHCVRVQLYGRTQIISEWARELGINYYTFQTWTKRGLDIEKTIIKYKLKLENW